VSGGTRSAPESGRFAGLTAGGWLAVACGVHILAGLILFEPTLFPGGDNAGYMILGRALRTLAGYRDLYLPGAPLHTKYPPAYPALLGFLGLVGGVQLFKLASLALTTTVVAMVGALGRRWLGAVGGTLAAFAIALNPVLLEYGHYVLSEAPFVAFVLFSVWTLEEESRFPAWMGILAAAAAFLTRTAGLPLLAAATLAPLLSRRWKRAGVVLAVALVAAGGWSIYQHMAAPGQAGYLRELILSDPYDPAQGTVGAAGLVARAARNLWSYVSGVLPGSITGGAAGMGAAAPSGGLLVAGLALTGLAAVGWIRRALVRLGTAELFAFLYAAMIALWPSVWTDRRFLLPLLPLLLLYALVGAQSLTERMGTRRFRLPERGRPGEAGAGPARSAKPLGRGAVAAAAALLLLPGCAYVVSAAPSRIRCIADYRGGTPCEPPAMASFYAAARWAHDSLPPDAIVANRKPRLFYWFSGRQGNVYRFTADPELLLRGLDEMGARFVVLDAISATTVQYLVPAVRAHADRFGVLYRGGEPPTWILAYRPPQGTAALPGSSPDGEGGSGKWARVGRP
jgi:hypothetical protein